MGTRRKDDEGLLSSRTFMAVGLGIVAGFWATRNYREIMRATVKGSITAGRTIRRVAEEVTEDIEDTVAEVMAETHASSAPQ